MKKRLIIFSLALISFIPTVYAQTKTATVSPTISTKTNSTEEKDIQNLKDKIATKVAELSKNSKKAVAGTIYETGGDYVNIKTEDNKDYKVKVDSDLTKNFSITGGSKKELKISDLEKDDYIIISGITLDKTINANNIYKDDRYLVKSGKITEINKTDYYLKVMTTDKDEYTLDIESNTKQQMMDIKSLEILKVGFSKIKEGDTIHFVVKKDTSQTQKNRFSVSKFLIIPQEYFIK